jgi:cytochrome c oxidase assembly factor CtaG
MVQEPSDPKRRTRPLALFALALTVIAAGVFLGATTNAVNGLVSPRYFITIMRWRHVENLWRACIAEGIFEGSLCGFFFAVPFTFFTGMITRASCTYRFALRYLLGIVAASYAFWAVGGLVAVGLSAVSPEWYRRAIIGVPEEYGPMLAYAWVGGSIWGLVLGGLLSAILGLVVMRSDWQRQRTPRAGWTEAFRERAERSDDSLSDDDWGTS